MKSQNVSKELRSIDAPRLANVNISYQLSDTKRSRGDCRGKKVRCIEQLDLDKLGQTINISNYLSRKNDKENSGKHATRHKKKSTDQRITSTFRRKKHHSNLIEDLQSTRPKPHTGRSAQQPQRLGKSLDYKRYLNKQMFPTKKSKSQSCSPRKKSTSKDKIRKPTIITTKTRPSSVRTSNPTQTLNTLLNTRFNKTDNSNKLRELLNSMKEESLREILENSFEKQKDGSGVSFQKRESSKKLKTKKKTIDSKRKQSGATFRQDFDELSKRFTKKKPLDEVYEDANAMDTQTIIEKSDSLVFRQHSDSKDTPVSEQPAEDIEIVKLTESEEINIIEIRDFEHKKLVAGRQSRNGEFGEPAKVQETKDLLLRYIEIFNADDDQDQEDEEDPSGFEKTNSFGIEDGSLIGSEVEFRVGRQGITAEVLRSPDLAPSSQNQYPHNVIQISPQQFYQQQQNNRKITVVSNLSDLPSHLSDQPTAKFQKIIKHIKQQQLHKWNNIVQIISQSLNSDSIDIKQLLKQIAQQSEQNYERLKHQMQSQKSKHIEHYHSLGEEEEANQEETNPFEEFNSNKYKELLDPSIVENLIKSREKFLAERQKTEKRLIDNKYETDQISIGSYKRNCDRLEKWVNAERVSIQKTRKEIEIGLCKAKQAIKKTQLDYVIMLKLKGSPIRPLKKSHSQQGFSRHLRQSRNKRKNQDTISLTSSQQQLQDYIHHAQFDMQSVEQHQTQNDSRLDSNNTVMLKQKLQKLNEQERDISDQQISEPSRVLRRQTNQPLHKATIEPDESISEVHSESEEEPTERIARIMRDSLEPEHLSEDCCREAFDDLVMEFLKEISMKDTMVEGFKKIKVQRGAIVKRRQKGIKTNIASVREYVRSLQAYLLENRMDALKTLERPTGPTAKQMLKYMHYYEDEPVQQDEQIQNSILSNAIFQDHWKVIQAKLQFQPQYTQPEREKARVEYLKGLTRIHYLSIFQAYNECLDQQRNYGTFGQPFPWKRVANFFHQKRQPPTIKKCLQTVSKRINSLATSFCGIIFDRDDNNVDYSQEYIAQIQDDRVTRMLALEVMENEHKWLFYDDEETEILVEVAFVIGETLVNELVLELHQMMFLR